MQIRCGSGCGCDLTYLNVDLNVDLLNECISYRVEWLTEAREDEGSTQKNKRRGGKKTWRGAGRRMGEVQ